MRFEDGLTPFGRHHRAHPAAEPVPLRQVILQKRLNRILAFTGLTIDDVVNSPIARNQVRGYYKLSTLIDRRMEIVELEQQWNPLGQSS